MAANSHTVEPSRAQPAGKRCRDCGMIVAKNAQRCGPCRTIAAIAKRARVKASEAFKSARRRGRMWRKAVERGLEAERFDPLEVLERDGWRCHLCGCKTPKSLGGTYDDSAPELDHIVPLSAGGHHTRANTACSCRKCNHAKGAKPLGQLRLVA